MYTRVCMYVCVPYAGDLAFNVALGATLVALPLSIGAAARSAFVKYKFTDKRVSVKTDAPWESECRAASILYWTATPVGPLAAQLGSALCGIRQQSSMPS